MTYNLVQLCWRKLHANSSDFSNIFTAIMFLYVQLTSCSVAVNCTSCTIFDCWHIHAAPTIYNVGQQPFENLAVCALRLTLEHFFAADINKLVCVRRQCATLRPTSVRYFASDVSALLCVWRQCATLHLTTVRYFASDVSALLSGVTYSKIANIHTACALAAIFHSSTATTCTEECIIQYVSKNVIPIFNM